jgi:hypothetical protein
MATSLGNCSPELDSEFLCDLAVPYEVIDPPSIQSGQPDEFLGSDSSLTLFDRGHCRPSYAEVFGHILLGETASLAGVLKASSQYFRINSLKRMLLHGDLPLHACRKSAKWERFPFSYIRPVHLNIRIRDLLRGSAIVSNRFLLDLKDLRKGFCERFPGRLRR